MFWELSPKVAVTAADTELSSGDFIFQRGPSPPSLWKHRPSPCFFRWYSRPELNRDPRFRKPLLYPFELREQSREAQFSWFVARTQGKRTQLSPFDFKK